MTNLNVIVHRLLATVQEEYTNAMEDTPAFPDPPAVTVERTLAIIKPDAIDQTEEIIEEIKRRGFTILQVHVCCYTSVSVTCNDTFPCLYGVVSLIKTCLDTGSYFLQ